MKVTVDRRIIIELEPVDAKALQEWMASLWRDHPALQAGGGGFRNPTAQAIYDALIGPP